MLGFLQGCHPFIEQAIIFNRYQEHALPHH
jgi:hypothetical protein